VRSVAFLGTPEPAVVALRALVDAGIEVALVVSRPDRRRGRGGTVAPSPVKAAALALGLPVSERVADVVDAGVDMGVVVAYGRIIARPVLEVLPMVNVHFSLLPRWRGAAPVERAMLAGDAETGVCLMALEEGLDTGGVYCRATTPVGDTESVEVLRARLAEMGAALLVDALERGLGPARPQEGTGTYAAKIESGELRLEWTQPATQLARVVRLGRAWTLWRGKRLLVAAASVVSGESVVSGVGDDMGTPGELIGDEVVTGKGRLKLLRVQPEGRGPLAADEWLRGARPAPGATLGS
jgi:methionyl-tRNA formyltransferase